MDDKQEIIETSKVLHGGTLYEQVYNPVTRQSHYMGWDKDAEKLIHIEEIIHDPIKYIPIHDELLDKKAVLLPSNAIDYGSVEDLELDIESFNQAWLDISKEHRRQATWYVMLSWVSDNLNTLPSSQIISISPRSLMFPVGMTQEGPFSITIIPQNKIESSGDLPPRIIIFKPTPVKPKSSFIRYSNLKIVCYIEG